MSGFFFKRFLSRSKKQYDATKRFVIFRIELENDKLLSLSKDKRRYASEALCELEGRIAQLEKLWDC
jgi:hypothetical protein